MFAFGLPMGRAWGSYGVPMESFFGIPIGCLLAPYGLPMGFRMDSCWISLGVRWVAYGGGGGWVGGEFMFGCLRDAYRNS